MEAKTETEAVTDSQRRSAVEDYLKAFEERDLEACVAHFTEDAIIQFGAAMLGLGQFRGRENIEQWHRDRFAGGAHLTKIESIKVERDRVRVAGVFGSPRLKAVRIPDLRGTGTVVFDGELFKELNLGLRRGYRFHI